MAKIKDLTGQKFGKLTAIKPVGKSKHGNYCWLCKCDCGNEKVIASASLLNGGTKSCGCLLISARIENIKKANGFYHGHNKKRLHRIYRCMIYRCTNPKSKDFNYYGGRGITVCEEWKSSYESFEKWAFSHGYDENAKQGECTLDRIDVNGNYEPSNCRWVTMIEQSNNKSCNITITLDNETLTLKQWSEILDLNYHTLHKRYKAGKSPEEILRKK